MQNVLYMAQETQEVPVFGNIFLIIRDVKYYDAFYIVWNKLGSVWAQISCIAWIYKEKNH